MALYVAICLLAALTALPESAAHTKITPLIWGVTVGLAVVHWFAFRVSARLVASGRLRPHDVELAGAQLVGAVGVALLASVPVVLLPRVRGARGRGAVAGRLHRAGRVRRPARRRRGTGTGAALRPHVLVVAVAIAELKNRLAGH